MLKGKGAGLEGFIMNLQKIPEKTSQELTEARVKYVLQLTAKQRRF